LVFSSLRIKQEESKPQTKETLSWLEEVVDYHQGLQCTFTAAVVVVVASAECLGSNRK